MRLISNVFYLSFMAYALAFVGGCASSGGASGTDSQASGNGLMANPALWEANVRERANLRWAHIRNDRFAEALDFYTEASKQGFTAEMVAITKRNISASDGVVDRVECSAEKCEVWVNVTITLRIPRVGNKQQITPLREDWIIEKGAFHLLRPR
jgi:hypothetical protein